MSTENVKRPLTLERINELKEIYFTSLKPDKNNRNVAFFQLRLDYDYTSLLDVISSLISISQNAIEGKNESEIPYCDTYDITNTLEIAKQLLPYSESEFLDLMK
ncbi:hypothetical protein [Tenacibaculum sp. M341]|uniref:hypothetical protein n=1 Tax=Tenacibaculum sp. M341 TaxID=2530339 RepID=UPI001044E7E1|nr:hypothetical protein [Tenacibaculum sp. M341]TCI85326.1 hypothetical protein EYW44_17280 [Tenacibaculum sp. M341]